MKKITALLSAVWLILAIAAAGCKPKKNETSDIKHGEEEKSVPSSITLSENALKIAGAGIEKAGLKLVPRKIHATGDVAFNQKRLFNLTSRIPGRVEEVHAFIGDKVKESQLLLSLYSSGYLASQAEFIQVLERSNRIKKDSPEADIRTAKALLDSAAARLTLMGMSRSDLKDLEETKQIKPLYIIRAPIAGNIIESPVVRGDHVAEGTGLFKIADLSLLWIHAHIYEKDLSRLKAGLPAAVRVQAYPDREFQGTLSLISDVVDEKTRTVIGRVEVLNRGGLLKPGMFADVDLIVPASASSLLVREAAVQDIEGRKIVFVPEGNNSFRTREVEIGLRMNGWLEILKGLSPGDEYVADGFLLKSELLKLSLEGHEHD